MDRVDPNLILGYPRDYNACYTYLWRCHYLRELSPISNGREATELPVLVIRRNPVVASTLQVQRHEIHAKVAHVGACVVRILKQVLGELKEQEAKFSRWPAILSRRKLRAKCLYLCLAVIVLSCRNGCITANRRNVSSS